MKKPPGLTAEEFEALLAELDPDRERAGEIYEAFRRKLVRFFEWRGCDDPEYLADETINRVARKLKEGVELTSSNKYGYFCGVAHLVSLEVRRQYCRQHRALEGGGWPPPEHPPEDEDPRRECLRRCLGRLASDERNLVLRYFQGENNILNRQALAGEMGIRLNALRIRVYRIRRKLEECVHECLEH